jgi:RHS repeat-associated protein
VAATTFPYLSQSTSVRKELGSCEDMGTVVTTNAYGDGYGNLTASTSTTTLADTVLTAATGTTYTNSLSPWVLGLPDVATVTKTTPAAGTQARVVKRTYLANLLDTETSQPDDVMVKMRKTYERNALGLVSAVVLSWVDPATGQAKSRYSSRVGYDPLNRFAISQTNALNQTETRDFDHGTGSPRSVIAIDGLTTSLRFDAFGRKEYEAAPDGNEAYTYERQCDSTCPFGAVAVSVKESRHGANVIAAPVVAYRDNAGHVLRTDTWGFDGQRIINELHYDGRGREMDAYWPRFDGAQALIAKHTEYDDLNRVVRIVTKDDANQDVVATNEYHGPSVTMKNGKQQVKKDERDGWNRLWKSTDAKGGVTRYEHDGFDNLTKTTDPKLNEVTVAYNSTGVRTDLRDPDLGWIHYDVDPLGRVWRQVSAMQRKVGQWTTMQYDDLDRMTDRLEPDLISHWRFDVAEGQSNCAANRSCGKLVEADTLDASANKSYVRTHSYDGFGRPDLTTTLIDLTTYTSRNFYDAWSRPIRLEHRRGIGAIKGFDQRYNDKGHLARIERAGLVLWSATAQDAANRVTQAHLGNGLDVSRGYNPHTGHLLDGSVSNSQGAQLQEGYQYDVLGNVMQRSQYWPGGDGFTETFEYDDLNRLMSSGIGAEVKIFRYDAIGNMVNKPDVSANDYVYPASGAGSVRPHAVSSVPGFSSFSYDDNGNLTDGAGRHVDWTSFDMPLAITKNSERSQFVYGPEHQRVRQIRSGTLPATIQYAGAMEVEIASSGTTVKTYWPAGLGVEIDRPGAGTTELNWTHVDRLGSVVGITDETGAMRTGSRMAFDAWGARRELNTNTPNPAIDGVVDNKGYTGHEMLDQLDLVHMNGRVYDPLIARFISADPIIQAPEHSQSYNRYTYVWNNPTNLTDPTGFVVNETDEPRYYDPLPDPSTICDQRCAQLRQQMNQAAANCNVGCSLYRNPRADGSSHSSDNSGGGGDAAYKVVAGPLIADPLTPGVVTQRFFRVRDINYGDAMLADWMEFSVLDRLARMAGASERQVFWIGIAGMVGNPKDLLRSGGSHVAHMLYKQSLRAAMQKPAVTNTALAHILNKIYRPNAKIGSGSTADAVRYEILTGEMVGGALHSTKAEDSIRSLKDWLVKNETALPGDRAAAENVILDLIDALGTKK